jgi:hypothetical protein
MYNFANFLMDYLFLKKRKKCKKNSSCWAKHNVILEMDSHFGGPVHANFFSYSLSKKNLVAGPNRMSF